jgi:hypothetical protein
VKTLISMHAGLLPRRDERGVEVKVEAINNRRWKMEDRDDVHRFLAFLLFIFYILLKT